MTIRENSPPALRRQELAMEAAVDVKMPTSWQRHVVGGGGLIVWHNGPDSPLVKHVFRTGIYEEGERPKR